MASDSGHYLMGGITGYCLEKYTARMLEFRKSKAEDPSRLKRDKPCWKLGKLRVYHAACVVYHARCVARHASSVEATLHQKKMPSQSAENRKLRARGEGEELLDTLRRIYEWKNPVMIAVSKSELKARMLHYFRKVEHSGEDLIVTSHRKPVLRVTRIKGRHSVDEIFSDVRGKVKLPESIVMEPETDEWKET